MIRQYIELGQDGWFVYVYYNVGPSDKEEITDFLLKLNCPTKMIKKSINTITRHRNTGLTFTNSDYKTSLVCISQTTSWGQFVNTIVHEAKHVQSHICEYYDIDESGEQAAYLIGHIVQRMYKLLQRLI